MRPFTIAQTLIEALETVAEAEKNMCRVEMINSPSAIFYKHQEHSFSKDFDSPPSLNSITQEEVALRVYRDRLVRFADFISKLKGKKQTKLISRDQFDALRYMFRFETSYHHFREVDEIYMANPSKDLMVLQEVINNVMIHFMEESYGDPRHLGIKCFNLRNMMIFFHSRPMTRAENKINDYVNGREITMMGYFLSYPTNVLILKCEPAKEAKGSV